MMRLLALLCAIVIAGCSGDGSVKPVDELATERTVAELQAAKTELHQQLAKQKKSLPAHLEAPCNPTPLPSVGWKIGDVEAYVGEDVLVPVRADTEGRPTWGGLLFVNYDASKLEIVCAGDEEWCEAKIVPGPQWDFQFGIGYRPEPGKLNTVIVGWQDDPFGGVSSDEPLYYLVFRAKKPGKAQITWRPIESNTGFFRRSEILTDVTCEDGSLFLAWDTIDFWMSQPNSTGATYVDEGHVLVRPKRHAAAKHRASVMRRGDGRVYVSLRPGVEIVTASLGWRGANLVSVSGDWVTASQSDVGTIMSATFVEPLSGSQNHIATIVFDGPVEWITDESPGLPISVLETPALAPNDQIRPGEIQFLPERPHKAQGL